MLSPALVGARFTRVTLNRADLRRPFPPRFAKRLAGQTVSALSRRGKYLLATLSSGDVLLVHLGMSGWFRIEPRLPRSRRDPDVDLERRHDHVVFEMSSGFTVSYTDPRRFGLMDLLSVDATGQPTALGGLGPEPLSRSFHAAALAAACAGRRIALKVALLDQGVVAGVGNIYASEALHVARLSPFRLASTIATRSGRPLPAAARLAAAVKRVLRRAIALKESARYRGVRFRVYEQEGQPCPTPKCRGTIQRAWQAGRSTFYCPVCQR